MLELDMILVRLGIMTAEQWVRRKMCKSVGRPGVVSAESCFGRTTLSQCELRFGRTMVVGRIVVLPSHQLPEQTGMPGIVECRTYLHVEHV